MNNKLIIELNNINENINFINKNSKKLSSKYKLIFDDLIITKFKILFDLLINKMDIYKDILNFIFNKKYKVSIEKYKPINNIKDIYILDNLHDFTNKRINKYNKNFVMMIRNIIIKYIKNKKILDIIIKKNEIININTDRIKKKLFKKFNIMKIEGNDNAFEHFKINKNIIYNETPKLFNMEECVCPYKKVIDQAGCNCDNEKVRENLILNNNKINIDNYNGNNININIVNNEIIFNINKNIEQYYSIFFEKQDEKNIYSLKFNNNYYKLNNSINGIISEIQSEFFKNFDLFMKNNINKEQLIKYLGEYILAGCHLKRLGDYAQLHIFNNSNLTYFQTIDEYCFLYATHYLDNDKIMVISEKFIFFKTKFENKQYVLCVQNDTIDFISIVKKKIKEILLYLRNNKKIQKAGHIEIMEPIDFNINDYHKKKIEINNKKNINYINNNMEDTEETNGDVSYDALISIIESVPYDIIGYILYKIKKDDFKILLGENFDFINKMIKYLKNFSLDTNINDENVRKKYESIVYFKKSFDISEINEKDKNFANVIEKLYNEINIKKFNKNSSMFANLLYNFEKYKVDINDDIRTMYKKIIAVYDWEPEYDEEGEPIYEKKTEQKGSNYNYLGEIIKLSNKYIKYKTKYLNTKNNNDN